MSTALVRIRLPVGRPDPRSLVRITSAFLRHIRARLWAAITNPAAIALLAFGSLTVIPLWWSMCRWLLASGAARSVIPGGIVAGITMPSMYLWVPLLMVTISGTTFVRHSTGSAVGPTRPVLPIGPRSRAVAEALVALLLILLARTVSLFAGLELGWELGTPLARLLVGWVVVLPLVLAWAGVPRLDGRGLLGPILVMCMLPLVFAGGLVSSLRAVAIGSLTLSALVLAAMGVEIDVDARRPTAHRRSLSFRASPGPVVRLRRDRWIGPLPRLAVLAGTLVLLVSIGAAWWGWGPISKMLGLPGLLILTTALFYPFGLKLASAAGPGMNHFWNGYFGRAWSTLPVHRRDVLRSVYGHGWIVGTALWLLLCGWVWSAIGFDGWAGIVMVAFEFAGIPLAAGVLVCSAAGDGRRGALALSALLAFQLVLPMSLPVARDLGVDFFRAPEHRAVVMLAGAYLLAVLGGLPPVVHLRGR